jgi:hypothetical protein
MSFMRQRRARRNPITPRDTTGPIFRSVSPEEMIDIVRTGRITGRGNAFSGDQRVDMVFFGTKNAKDVMHNGEDTLRQVSSSPAFQDKFRALDTDLEKIESEREYFAGHMSDFGYSVPRAQDKRFSAWRKLQDRHYKAHKKVQDAMYATVTKLRDQHRRKFGATSFTIELRDVPGGVLYTSPDSSHQTDEVGFKRKPGVSAEHIAWVSVVLDGKVAHKMPYDKFVRLLGEKVAL